MTRPMPNRTLKTALILPIVESALTKILLNSLLLISEGMYLSLPQTNKIFSLSLYLKSPLESQSVLSPGVMIMIRLSLGASEDIFSVGMELQSKLI